ncbi:MAG: hypothetical protein WDW38_010828 [Sanguina aurantia]
MEDAFAIHRLSAPSSPTSSPTADSPLRSAASPLPGHHYFDHDLILFGAYDGHGGREVADHCSEQLHQHFAARLAEIDCRGPGGTVARRTTPQDHNLSAAHPVLAAIGLHEAVGRMLNPRSPLHPDHQASGRGRHHATASHPSSTHGFAVTAGAAAPPGSCGSSNLSPYLASLQAGGAAASHAGTPHPGAPHAPGGAAHAARAAASAAAVAASGLHVRDAVATAAHAAAAGAAPHAATAPHSAGTAPHAAAAAAAAAPHGAGSGAHAGAAAPHVASLDTHVVAPLGLALGVLVTGVETHAAEAARELPPLVLALPHSSYVQAVEDALHYAFKMTDEELMGTETGEDVGATAVVAVLGKEHIWIAHCGDSRAVVQRSGEAVPVTQDHKPDREDEAARVRAAGGKVVYAAGSYRVNGMLAMSRAIGDHFLRPYVIAEPEITVLHRSSQDEVLIIATDGLWDVFGNSEAATLATRCITRSMDRGMSRHGACRVAASVLTKVALERGSRDNITVIVVDITLQQSSGDAEGDCNGHVVPSSHPEGRLTEGDESAGERGSGKAANPNNHSVGTHFRIKSRPSSEAGDGGGRNHGAGHSALDDRPPKRFNSGVSLPQPQPSQAPTLSQAAATAKQARFPTSLDSSTAPQPTTRCWTTVLLGRSPRPASPANPSLKRSSFQSSQSSLTPSLQSSAEERTAAASAPELPSTDPSLSAWSELSCTNRPCHAAAGGTTTTTTTASESMFAAATAASGQGFIAPPKDVELPATDWTFKVQQSSSAAPS